MQKTRPAYAPEFRQKIVDLVRSRRPVSAIAKEFKVANPTIREWMKKSRSNRKPDVAEINRAC